MIMPARTIVQPKQPWWWNLNFLVWAKELIRLPNGQPVTYANRPYLHEIAASNSPRIVLRAGRQVEKSTTIAVMIALTAFMGRNALYVSARQEQVRAFSRDYLNGILHTSPLLCEILSRNVGRKQMVSIANKYFSKARVHLRAAYDGSDALRGLSVDTIFFR